MVDLRAMQPLRDVCHRNCVTAIRTTGLGEVMEWLQVLYCVCHHLFEQRLFHICLCPLPFPLVDVLQHNLLRETYSVIYYNVIADDIFLISNNKHSRPI